MDTHTMIVLCLANGALDTVLLLGLWLSRRVP